MEIRDAILETYKDLAQSYENSYDECIKIMKKVAGTIYTLNELYDLQLDPCDCAKCTEIHKVQEFLLKKGVTWDKFDEKI
jgi:hypothetical protein